jgi:glycosyltransferase involved in cell wall biosynthesis
MTNETVTILMPSKNGMPFVKEAVQSVLEQEYEYYRLLIINDGSTDETIEYIQSLNNKKISIVSGSNLGIVGALNLGLEHVKTKYVAILDADDKCESNRLQSEVTYLEEHPECVLVGTSIGYIGTTKSKREVRVKLPSSNPAILDGLKKHKFVVAHSSIMMRTDALIKCGKYNANSLPIPDIDLFLRIAKEGELTNLTKIYSPVRLRSDSFTYQNLYDISGSYRNYNKGEEHSMKKSLLGINRFNVSLNYYSQLLYKKALIQYLNGKSPLWLLMIPLAGIINLPQAIYFLREKFVWGNMLGISTKTD